MVFFRQISTNAPAHRAGMVERVRMPSIPTLVHVSLATPEQIAKQVFIILHSIINCMLTRFPELMKELCLVSDDNLMWLSDLYLTF